MPILGTVSSQFSGKPFGSFESISTVSLNSSQATIEFTSIPATYTHLQLRFIARGSYGSDSGVHIRFNSDTGSNYSRHRVYGENTTAGSDGSDNNTEMVAGKIGNVSNIFGAAIIDILDYANTNKYKTIRGLVGHDRNASGGIVLLASGNWRNTNAVTSILLRLDDYSLGGEWQQYSQFSLYGIKGV